MDEMMDRNELNRMIGIDMSASPANRDCQIFVNNFHLILLNRISRNNMFVNNEYNEGPFHFIRDSIQPISTKIYFSTETTDIEYILNFLESTLDSIQDIAELSIQGNRIVISGKNKRTFSITVFEIEETQSIKDWVINISIPSV